MDRKTLEKANSLNDRIERLEEMKRDLRPEHCNGVGVCGRTVKNEQNPMYSYHLWSTHKSNTDDRSLIMRVGIKAMYDEICRLLEFAKADLKALK